MDRIISWVCSNKEVTSRRSLVRFGFLDTRPTLMFRVNKIPFLLVKLKRNVLLLDGDIPFLLVKMRV